VYLVQKGIKIVVETVIASMLGLSSTRSKAWISVPSWLRGRSCAQNRTPSGTGLVSVLNPIWCIAQNRICLWPAWEKNFGPGTTSCRCWARSHYHPREVLRVEVEIIFFPLRASHPFVVGREKNQTQARQEIYVGVG
jgi:hypothetical protein